MAELFANHRLEWKWKEAAVACFKTLRQHPSDITAENYEEPQLQQSIFESVFEIGIPQI
jgi:hypothetical protein